MLTQWQGKPAWKATFGNVTVLVFAADVGEAMRKIAAIVRQYALHF